MYWIRASSLIYVAVMMFGIYGLKNTEYQKLFNGSIPIVGTAMFIEGMYQNSLKTKTGKR